ncbi:MAG: glucose 1-dehydrogenase [Chloroflexota bacterium]|nr:glucose 1-dehydrogenase [Chloroflexota bacterium]MDE2909937.1 glucose 1-dehydrogenase [Chloroflexota bacterium]
MSYSDFDFSGKTALITGGGRGIGLATARRMAAAGADVIIAEYIVENGKRTAAEIQSMGRESMFIEVDVRCSESVNQMAAKALETFPNIDILVCNAGIAQAVNAEECSDEDWLNMMAVNLNGVFWCCRAIGRHMLERGSGAIVNVASMSGMISNTPQPQAHYNASKAGVILLTKSLAGEWANRGLRVNCVSPGYIGTDMTLEGFSNDDWRPTWLGMTPQGRIGAPEEIAQAIFYLASPGASFTTGSNLVVDGGYTAW